jgi:hypothetical protein
MLFISRPFHLSEKEADRWIRSQAAAIGGTDAITRMELSRLQSPAARGDGADWDWLIEMHCDGIESASRAAREEGLRDLLADLRLLGMRPRLLLADGTQALTG